jgi:two-component system, OmpR family, response regulator RegX3
MAQRLRLAAPVLDELDIGVLALDGRSKPIALNKKAQELLVCQPDGSGLPRPVLDLVENAWRCDAVPTLELVVRQSILRLHARRLEGVVWVQVHDVSLLRHLQQAHRLLVTVMSDRLLERMEGPALLIEALASVDDPMLAAQWLQRLKNDVAELARLVGDPQQGMDPERVAQVVDASSDPGPERPRPTLLLVEPVTIVAEAMTVALSNAGIDTVTTPDPHAALEVVKVAEPDCMLVDIGQGGTTSEATQRLREATPVPMVLLTGTDAEPAPSQEITGDAATIVLQRPLRLRELIAKIEQVLTTAQDGSTEHGANGLIEGGEVVLDTLAQTVWVRGRRTPMSHRERQLLRVLLLHPGRVLSNERLLELAWGSDASGSTLPEYIGRLRRKIERDPSHPTHIITVRGIGVRFEVLDPADRQ